MHSAKAARNMTLWVAALLAVMVAGSGCAKNKLNLRPGSDDHPIAGADSSVGRDSDSGSAFGLQTVRFRYDSFALTEDAMGVARGNARILQERPELQVQIEGHCDSRGGTQYNIALGEKRANATRDFLLELGVPKRRISIVSFGKERLLDQGDSEDAHARNRRANFVVTGK